MNDIVYLYPKTSCPCGECGNKYKMEDGPPTNLSVSGCKVSPYFDCYSSVELNSELQPKQYNFDGRIKELNPQCYTDKLARGFGRVPCPEKASGSKTCNNSYLSLDPRLYSTTRMDYLTLDRPPMDGDVRLKDIYSSKYNNYGTGFMPYSTIKDGQIVYYVDKATQDAFFKPVFTQEAKEVLNLYKDPMGAMKPEANRVPVFNTENPTTVTKTSFPYGLSFLQDTNQQREDIMSYQQRKHNQQKWSVRWPVK